VPQTITNVSADTLPIDMTVVLDVSFSVRGAPLARLENGVRALMSDLKKEDRLRLIAVNDGIRRVLDFTSDPQAVDAAIRSLSATGGTAVFDALTVALVSPVTPDRRQLVAVFTDGADGSSVTDGAGLVDAARHSPALLTVVLPRSIAQPDTMITMAVPMPQAQSDLPASATSQPIATIRSTAPTTATRPEPVGRQMVRLLTQAASETGGRVLTDPGPPQDLGSAFRQALSVFRASYVIYFTPRGVDRTGFHTLVVKVRNRNGLTVRARSGYSGG
jgi:VWFA-related protein